MRSLVRALPHPSGEPGSGAGLGKRADTG